MKEVKIEIKLDASEWHGSDSETIWSEETKDGYRLRNIPFYAFGFAYDDLVEVKQKESSFSLVKKLKNSGHSTYRIFRLDDSLSKFEFYLEMLTTVGCTFERATDKLYAIDVAPDVDIFEAYKIMELGEKKGIWDFEEGHCGHPQILKVSSK